VENILAKPFKILFAESMLIAITLYMSVSCDLCLVFFTDLIADFSFDPQFVYGCVYLLFEAYPIVYTEGHHMNAGASGLMFIPLFLGGAIAVFIVSLEPLLPTHSTILTNFDDTPRIKYLWIFNPQYEKLIKQYAPDPVPPEHRLTMAIWAGPPFVISFFWFGCVTSSSSR
jgi:hypothetical protein